RSLNVPPSLYVVEGHDQGTLFELEEGTLGIGRDAANHIQIHDTEVSRRHAELRFDGTQCFVADLNSSNGTYLNGQRIPEQSRLTTGDKLQVGATRFLFTDEQSDADVSDKIDIVNRDPEIESSRIVRSMTQREGSEILKFDSESAASPWLARARSN